MHHAAERTRQHDEKQQTGLEIDSWLKATPKELDIFRIRELLLRLFVVTGSASSIGILLLSLPWLIIRGTAGIIRGSL